jgi:hypothetical protein
MTVTARTISSWSPIEGLLELITDGAVYKDTPTSFTNPALAQNEVAGGVFTAFCNGIDLDYKFTPSGEIDEQTLMAVLASPPVGDAIIICLAAETTDWTHVHVDLTPGIWSIIMAVISRRTVDPVQGWIDNIELTPSLVLTKQNIQTSCVQIPLKQLILTGYAPSCHAAHIIPSFAFTLGGNIPNFGPTISLIPVKVLILTGRNPSYVWTVPANLADTAQTIYKCVLTGSQDGTTDLIIPISSFQARIRDGDPSYLSCVIPDSDNIFQSISARSSGDIVIYKGFKFIDGTEQIEEIIRVEYESVQVNSGANAKSLMIAGHKTVASSAPKDVTVVGVSFYGLQANGKRRVRANLDLFLRVGDCCIYGTDGNDYFTVGQISYIVSAVPPSAIMEVTEA